MLKIEKIDTSVLKSRIVKSAQLHGRSIPAETVNQAGLLQGAIVAAMPPKNLTRAKKRGASDVGEVFFPFPANPNIEVGHRGNGEMYWLVATRSVLIGAKRENVQPDANISDMAGLYKKRMPRFSGGAKSMRHNKQTFLGKRGLYQYVERIDRVLVKRTNIEKFKKIIADKFGRLKGSWAHSWTVLNKTRPQPAKWIMKHVASGKARGAVIVNLHGDKSNVTLISRATGCEGEAALRGIRSAIKKRAGAIAADIRNQLRGDYKKAGFRTT